MAEHLEYIDSYFNKELSDEERRQFDQRVEQDPAFAEEVAFYLNTFQSIQAQATAERKQRFRGIYEESKSAPRSVPLVRKLWPYVASAAAILIVVMGIYLFQSPATVQDYADTYITENFQKLSVTMDPEMDSVKAGIQYFNDKKLDTAQIYFETILQRNTTSTRDSALFEVMEFAGITSLMLKQYDKAIDYFSRMEKISGLYANNGMFYHAIALIERKQPGDIEEAKKLLQTVAEKNLAGKEEAEKWLKSSE